MNCLLWNDGVSLYWVGCWVVFFFAILVNLKWWCPFAVDFFGLRLFMHPPPPLFLVKNSVSILHKYLSLVQAQKQLKSLLVQYVGPLSSLFSKGLGSNVCP